MKQHHFAKIAKLIILIMMPILVHASPNINVQNIIGTWTVTKYFHAADIEASESVLQSYIGQNLIINAGSISFNKSDPITCNIQSVNSIKGDASQYFQNIYQADLSMLPLINPIIEVGTYCNDI